jgi:hypothetical protein
MKPIRVMQLRSPGREEKPLLLECRLAEHTTMAELNYAFREGLVRVEELPEEPATSRRGKSKTKDEPKK